MKDKIGIIVLIIIFILLLVLCNTMLIKQQKISTNKVGEINKDNELSENSKTTINENSENFIKEDNNVEKSFMNEKVLEITSENFEKEVLESEKTVLVDFYADWCGPCKMLSPIVEEVAEEEENIKFVKLNIDNAEDIAIQYQVMSIPTLVVIKNGEEVNRSVGLIDKEKIKELIK